MSASTFSFSNNARFLVFKTAKTGDALITFPSYLKTYERKPYLILHGSSNSKTS